jgi:hypothetical protein
VAGRPSHGRWAQQLMAIRVYIFMMAERREHPREGALRTIRGPQHFWLSVESSDGWEPYASNLGSNSFERGGLVYAGQYFNPPSRKQIYKIIDVSKVSTNHCFRCFRAFEGPSCSNSDSRETITMCHFKDNYFESTKIFKS